MDNYQDNIPIPNRKPEPTLTSEPAPAPTPAPASYHTEANTKFCKFCGSKIPFDAVLCTSCGRQVEELKQSGNNNSYQQPIIINNSNNSSNNINSGYPTGRQKDKWVALLLCIFLGWLGVHKFYEGKILMGILYIITCGFFGIGIFVDFILILLKPNPYYV